MVTFQLLRDYERVYNLVWLIFLNHNKNKEVKSLDENVFIFIFVL